MTLQPGDIIRSSSFMIGGQPDAGAVYGCGQFNAEVYRYRLWRTWDVNRPRCLFVMLNPSTATEETLDPTVKKCVGYAERWGFGGLDVGNLFALRSTDPRALYGHADPVGPTNDEHLREMARGAALVMCAWGNHHRALKTRGADVAEMLARTVYPALLECFGTNQDGSPRHPLYLSSQRPRVIFEVGE